MKLLNKISITIIFLFFLNSLQGQDTKQNKSIGIIEETKNDTKVSSVSKIKLPKANCFCVVSYIDLTDKKDRAGVCMDLTSRVNKTYTGTFPENDNNRKDCQRRCSDAAVSLSIAEKQQIADCACANGAANGTVIRAYSAVGVKNYNSDQAIGRLVNQPEITKTTCQCPSGWLSNTTNQEAGISTDGRCKKLVCSPFSVSPYPADGTHVGNWGFTWGNSIYAYGTKENGGAAICKTEIISKKVCKIE